MSSIASRVPQIKIPGKVQYLLLYTIAFAVIFVIGYSEFLFGDYTFLLYGDALVQTFPSFIYVGEYFRALPGHIANGELPMYDFSIGLGDDILSTLLAPMMPLNILLFTLTSRESAYAMYIVVFVTQLYFSGLTFTFYCYDTFRNSNIKRNFILLAALVYMFSGWSYVYTLRHPTFILLLLYFPLILAGFDRILRDKKPHLFIFSIFLSGITGFYGLYMATIFIIVYAFIRIHYLHKDDFWKNIWKYGVRSVSFYLIGFAMAAFVIIPLIITHFSTGRGANITTGSLLYYPISNIINSFVSYPSATTIEPSAYNVRIGLSAIVPVALIMLFFQKPYKKHLLIGVIITFLVQNIPFGTFLLNGFAYPTNRPEFMFNFVYCIALIFLLKDIYISKEVIAGQPTDTELTDDIEGENVAPTHDYVNRQSFKHRIEKKLPQNINAKAVITLLTYALLLSVTLYIIPYPGDRRLLFLLVGIFFVLLFILIMHIPTDSPKFSIFTEKRKFAVLGVMVVLNITITVNTFNLYENIGYVSKTAEDMFEDYVEVSDFVEDDSFYRQGTPFTLSWWHFQRQFYVNEAILSGHYGFAEYWSFMNPSYVDFGVELENSGQAVHKWRIDEFNNRAPLYLLTSVKYLFTSDGYLPYGYEYIADLPYRELYQNMYALPLGYTYDKSISVEDYAALHPLDKQDAIMQAVALPQEYANTDVSALSFDKTEVPHTSYMDENNLFIIEIDGYFEYPKNFEIYVRFIGLGGSDRDTNYATIAITVNDNDEFSVFSFTTQYDVQYSGMENYLIRLEKTDEEISKINLQFSDGDYIMDGIEVFCLPMDSYAERALSLGEDVLENIVVGTNSITGDITLDEEKILVLSIPYSRGWSATVNGASMELLQANTAFMALPLPPGHHEIELSYITPGLRLGAAISLIGLISFIGICIFYKKAPQNKKAEI